MAFEVLSQICQQYGDELTGSAAGTFSRVDPSIAVWAQHNHNALIRDQDERADSSSPAMSVMFAVMKTMTNSRCTTYNEFVSDALTQENQNNLHAAAKGHKRAAEAGTSGSF